MMNTERTAQRNRLAKVLADRQAEVRALNAEIASGAKFTLRVWCGTFNVLRLSFSESQGTTIHTDGNGGFGQSFVGYAADCVRVHR